MGEELRHQEGCRFAGLPFSPGQNIDHEHCICDPDPNLERVIQRYLELEQRRRFLWQDEFWWDRVGDRYLLDDLSLRWKKNIVAFLERRAELLHSSWIASTALGPQPSGDMATDAFDSMLDEVMEQRPMTWLYQTPLMLRLDLLIKLGQDGPIDRNAETVRA